MPLLYRVIVPAISGIALLAGVLGMMTIPFAIQSTPTPEALPQARTIPFTDVNPVGANFFLSREVEDWKKERTLEMAKAAGVGWIKEIFAWEEIEPKKGIYFDEKFRKTTWEKYDRIVDLAEKHGLRIIARLDRPPAWSRKDNQHLTAPPDRMEDYGDFVAAVVKRYAGRVQFFQIWNEPNIFPEWGDRPVDPAGYTQMLKLAYQRAKEASPDAVILSAPLAQTLEKSPINLTELEYLDGMYKAGARGAFDILSSNAYGFEFPPDAQADPNVLNYSRLQLLRQVMVQNGDTEKAIWFNEFGWNASPPSFPPEKLIWRRVTEQQQASYTVDGIKLARAWGWAGVVNIWYFRQVGDITPDRSDYYFRMVDPEFTPRPIYLAVQSLGESLRVAAPGVHQESNASVDVSGPWSFRLFPEASGGAVLQPREAGAALTLTFEGTDLTLIAGRSPQGGRLLATIDGKDAALGQKDASGRSYVDLSAPQPEFGARIAVAKALPLGRHTLRLEPVHAPDREWLIDGFQVDNKPLPPANYAVVFIGLALVGIVGLVTSLLLFQSLRPRTGRASE